MAVINYTTAPTRTSRACVATWAALANGAEGQPLELAQYSDRTIQVSGTFGAGGNLRLLGSNDGVNWNTLTDAQGVEIDIGVADIKFISEATLYIKPFVTAGDGATSLTVTILLKE